MVISLLFLFFGLPFAIITGVILGRKEKYEPSRKQSEEEYENYYGITSYKENHEKYFGHHKK